MHKICVVIVTYNRYDMLNRCLLCLEKQTYQASSVILIDNSSTDDTMLRVLNEWCKKDSRINYHRLKQNIGGAGGFKIGMEFAFEEDCNWILMMDDDAAMEENYIEKLLDSYSRNPEVKCFTGSEYVGYTGIREYGGRRRVVNHNTLEEKIVDENEYLNNKEFYIDSFTFVGVMFDKETAIKTGLPDNSLFIYYDDTDYSFRIRKYTKILCISDAIIHHRTDDISEKNNELNKEWRKFYLIRNNLVIKKRYTKYKSYYYLYLIKFIAVRTIFSIKSLLCGRNSFKVTIREMYVVGCAVLDIDKLKCIKFQPKETIGKI